MEDIDRVLCAKNL